MTRQSQDRPAGEVVSDYLSEEREGEYRMKLTLALIALLLLTGCSRRDDGELAAADAPPRQRAVAEDPDLWAQPMTLPKSGYFDIEGLTASLPKAADVPIPAYPGARAILYAEPQGKILTRIGLLTSDEPEEVFAFYRERLDGWRHHSREFMWVLWDSESDKPITASSYTVPAVEIRSAIEQEISQWPEARTYFTVVY